MTEQRKQQYDKVYMNMAKELASLSYALRSKVGCIIVSKEGQIISQGYNGTPSGRDNCCEYTDMDGEFVSKREVLHAESNAIIKCARWAASTNGATLYVTLSPCFDCAKMIVQAGIERVVYHEEYRNTEGLDLLKECGVQVDHMKY